MSNFGTALAVGLSAWPLLDPKSYHKAQEEVYKFTRSINLDDIDVSRPVYVNGYFISGGSKEEVLKALHSYDDGTYGPISCYGRIFVSNSFLFDVVNRDVVQYVFDGKGHDLVSVNPNTVDLAAMNSDRLFQGALNGSSASVRSLPHQDGFVNKYYYDESFSILSNRPIKNSGTFNFLGSMSTAGSIPLPDFAKTGTYHIVSLASNEVLVVRGRHAVYGKILSAFPLASLGDNRGDSASDKTRLSEHYQTALVPNYVFNNLYYYTFDQLNPDDRTGGGGSTGNVGYRHLCLCADGSDAFYTVVSRPNLVYNKELEV